MKESYSSLRVKIALRAVNRACQINSHSLMNLIPTAGVLLFNADVVSTIILSLWNNVEAAYSFNALKRQILFDFCKPSLRDIKCDTIMHFSRQVVISEE